MGAGFVPRPTVPAPGGDGSGSGFASGGPHDTLTPGPALATAAAAAGSGMTRLDDDELIGILGGWTRLEAWAAAGKLAAMNELGRRRATPAGRDAATRRGQPAPWGKFCPDEIAAALAISRRAATRHLGLGAELASRLPLTRHALEEGRIDLAKAQIIADATAVLNDADAAAAEALVLPGITGKNPGQVRYAIGRAVLATDPQAARRRREEAEKDARVELWREDAGTTALCGFNLPTDDTLKADEAITAWAHALKAAGLPGDMDALRARAYLDLLLSKDSRPTPRQPRANHRPLADGHPDDAPAEADSPPSPASPPCPANHDDDTAAGHAPAGPASPGRPDTTGVTAINLTIPLTTLLDLTDHPGEAAGFGPIDPGQARDMAASAAQNPRATWCVSVTDDEGHPTAHGCAKATPARRKPRTAKNPGTGPPRTPRGTGSPSTGSPSTGAARNGTGPPGDHDGGPAPGTGRPGAPGRAAPSPGTTGTWRLRPVPGGPDLTVSLEPIAVTGCDHRHQTPGHDPGRMLRHLVQIRDAECTWPPCRRAAEKCDFEHAVPWEAGGATCACNTGLRC